MSALEENLRAVRARIDAAARAAGRDPAEVRLLAVSKTWPAEDVRALAALGQLHFAENRVQELTGKAAELADLPDLRWHLVGQLQRNKAAAVVRLGAPCTRSTGCPWPRTQPGRRPRAAARRRYVQVDLGGPEGQLGGRGGAAADVPGWPTWSPQRPACACGA